MKKTIEPLTVEHLRSAHESMRTALRQRLAEFANVPTSDYFYEIVYCLLTPQSSAFAADKAVRRLRLSDFRNRDVDPEPLLHQHDYYIRFHRTKARHLLALKAEFSAILAQITSTPDNRQLREWLVCHVVGLGWKEASHILRNIGRRDLAILDRHILRNLLRLGVLHRLPKTLTARRYEQIEGKFHTFAQQIGIPMDELDLLLWSMETGEIFK